MRRLALLALAAACDSTPYQIDQFPIGVRLDSGALIAKATPDIDSTERVVVIDTGSPLTMIERGPSINRQSVQIELDNQADVPRARFPGNTTFLVPSAGSVGWGTDVAVGGVIGGDLLSELAVRIDPMQSQLQLFPDIFGDEEPHGDACQAVFPTPLRGGGTLVMGTWTVRFPATRLTIGACLDPSNECLSPTGTTNCSGKSLPDALLVVATGIQPLVLSTTAYGRAYTSISGSDPPDVTTFPQRMLDLPGGTSAVSYVTTLPALALAASESSTRGPCAELLASRVMERAGCTGQHCPFPDEQLIGTSGATVELQRMLDVAVVADTDPLFQGLRAELAPNVAEVDGILGMQALSMLLTDVDYPDSRMIFCCEKVEAGAAECDTTSTSCIARPRIAVSSNSLARQQQLVAEGCLDPSR